MAREVKTFIKCSSCQKDITGVVNKTESGDLCFRCFVSYRQNKRVEEFQKEKNAAKDLMYVKKIWCPKCKSGKNDFELVFCFNSYTCIKCGMWLSRSWQKLFKEKISTVDGN